MGRANRIGAGKLATKVFGGAAALALVAMLGPVASAPAIGEDAPRTLPDPPADGVMGFVVSSFMDPIVPGTEACPDGPSPKLRDIYLRDLDPAERARLRQPENQEELEKGWRSQVFGPNDTNICSQPDMFDRPLLSTVQNGLAWGLDLDGDGGAGKGSDTTCAGEDFRSPQGMAGVDNQSYRVQGCKLEWRGIDGMPSDISVGVQQFHKSGEWTQVILLRGVDSLVRDDDVDVIYGNTPDRPYLDSKGQFLHGGTFSISVEPPRHRNVLKGQIRNGVLTTEPTDIKLTQTWGQGGARDIRGNRSIYDYNDGRLRLEFQQDGSLKGLLGGYRPFFDIIVSPSLGGVGSAVVAGIDCAAELKTLRKYADGMRNPETGQCEGISSAHQITAVPAFVNDIPPRARTAAR